jgi:enoyl-CoA hydratase/carnithine racemase
MHAGGFSLVGACDMAFIAEDATTGLPVPGSTT